MVGWRNYFNTIFNTLSIAFIIILYVRMSTYFMKGNGFTLKMTRNRLYPTETMTETDYTDDLVLLEITFMKSVDVRTHRIIIVVVFR